MTTSSTVTRPASTPTVLSTNPTRFCTECRTERSIMERRNAALNGMCESCSEKTGVTLAAVGLDATTGDVRRCGACDANIAELPAAAQYCSATCRAEAATAADQVAEQAEQATKPAKTKPLDEFVATAVRWTIRDNLTEFEIRTGLNAAFIDRRDNGGGRFTPEGIAAAGRAWFEDYNRNTAEKGKRNTAILRALKAADRLR
jgi:hypothetical protein